MGESGKFGFKTRIAEATFFDVERLNERFIRVD